MNAYKVTESSYLFICNIFNSDFCYQNEIIARHIQNVYVTFYSLPSHHHSLVVRLICGDDEALAAQIDLLHGHVVWTAGPPDPTRVIHLLLEMTPRYLHDIRTSSKQDLPPYIRKRLDHVRFLGESPWHHRWQAPLKVHKSNQRLKN